MDVQEKQSLSPGLRWLIRLFIAVALALMINVIGLFIMLMFIQTDGDALVRRYLVDGHADFLLVTGGLALLLLPLVSRIPFKVE